MYIFQQFILSYMVFGSVANSFRCTFLRVIECFLLRKNISNFAEATREKRFTTMMPLGMSRDVMCHRLWRHNCFSNSIQIELIYHISIWTSQNWLEIRTFLCIIKRNEHFDHPSYMYKKIKLDFKESFEICNKWPKWQDVPVDIKFSPQGVVSPSPGAIYMYKIMKKNV